MRATSELYKQIIASGETRNYHVLINITLADDTYITIRDSDIIENSFKILTASSGQNSLDIGSAIIGKCQFTLKNFDDEWTDYDFFDAEAVVWVGLEGDETNGTQNYLRVGFFTVDEPQYSGSMVSLELLDNMWKFDKDLPSIPLPQTIGQIVNRLCTHCGVTLSSNTFNGATYQIIELPNTQMNCRELLQYVAMIGCNFCVMNDQGALVVKWYDTASRPSDNLDGGTFSSQTTPYSDGDSADGGNFTNYNTGDDIDGGTFTDNSSVAYFTRLFSRNIGTDIITVTGVKIRINDTDYLRGKEGYVLVLENPLVTESNVSTVLNMIWNRLKDFNFRTFNVTALPDIAPEVGDCVGVSYKGNMVYSYLTNYTFTPTLSTASLGAVTPTRTLSQRYSKAVQAAVEVARERVTQEIGAYDLAAQRMNQLAINAMGGYTDFEDSPTGGRIYYLSNAPITKNEQGMCEFPETAVVYKTTGDGFFISTGVDPQTHVRTWTQGYTPSTGLLVELLTALKINAEQIFTGKLEVGGSQTGVAKPYIRVLDGSDNVICTIDYRGIIMNSGYIASSNYAEQTPEGTFSLIGMKIDVNGNYVKSPHFAFNNSGAYIDGEVIANSGQIGAATITQDAIKIIGDVDLYNGSSSFTFKPADYYFLENFKLLFKTSSGTSTVTLVRHQNGTDTTVGTYTADTEGVESATIDRTLGGDNYYRITVTASTEVIAHDVVIAYMGMEGFRGVLQGIFKGYLESNSGIINGLKYSGSGAFFGSDITLRNADGKGNHEADIHLEGGTSSSEPTITRTYYDGSSEVTEEVAWGNKQNFIEYELLPPSGNGRVGDLKFVLSSAGKTDLYRVDENGIWGKLPIGAQVEANTADEPTDELNSLKIDDVVYAVPKGVDYSTTEQDTGTKYLDGSTIYQRSFLLSTALSLASNTWTNAIQSSTIGEIISAEGKNADGDMIGIIGRVNNGYTQVLSLMTATQTLSILTLKYLKALGGYAFNENYQQGSTYTFAPTIEPETFLIWAIKHFIQVCKSKGSDWNTAPVFSYVLTNITSIVSHFMQYKGDNNGIGVTLNAGYEYNEYRMSISVAFTNGNKTGRIDQGYTAHGDESKYIWGNESQSSLWATRGEYWVKITANGQESWVTPEWAYTMYCRYIGMKYYDNESSTSISTEDVCNYGIHLL